MMLGFIHLCIFIGITLFQGCVAVDPPYNVPTCTPTSRNLDVPEDTAVGSVLVSTLSCTDADTGPEGTLKYRMVLGATNKFTLDEDNGQLSLVSKLNADGNAQHYLIEVEVYDQGSPSLNSTVVINIYVTSVNDNAPRIRNLPRYFVIDDNTPIGTRITGCDLSDGDHPNGGLAGEVRVRKLSGGDPYDKFYVDHMNCDIYLRKRLYYEKRSRYDLKLVATDLDPDIPKSTTGLITIFLSDGNSYPPECSEYLKLLFIPESTAVGDKIYQISCSDKDTFVDGELRYLNAGGDTDVLKVDFFSGAVSLKAGIDYESGVTDYSLNVRVRDNAFVNRFTVTVEVRVTVTNSDDEPLKWSPSSVFTTSVPEDIPTGSIILTTQAEDLDVVDDVNNHFVYGFDVPPTQPWFTVDPGTGSVVVSAPLDRDTLSVATFDIFAYSNSDPSVKIVSPVTVTITDINDERPAFTKSIYDATFPEHTTAGTTVTTVTANDPDLGSGGEVEYSIEGTFFNIDPTSGVVTTAAILDYADGLTHTARVTARDKGVARLSSQSMVILIVTPVNDHAPVFSAVLDTTIPEDTLPGTPVYQVTATDQDFGHDGEVSYTIQDPSVPFFIDSNSGQLFTGFGLDREVAATWDIVVTATDGAKTSPKSTSITVHFDVGDVNDNVPVCNTVPKLTLLQPYVTGSNLTTLVCSDKDINGNKELYYDIIAGDPTGVFTMSTSGDLILSTNPTTVFYALVLRVRDGGVTPLSTILTVRILVEIGLTFTSISTINIEEAIVPGDAVVKVEACCAFSSLIYEIISGNDDGKFGIDERSGQVYMLDTIDRETIDTYTVGVRAKTIDGSQAENSSFDVIVGDINDNSPMFGSSFYKIAVVESWVVNTGIQIITATDSDIGANAMLTYSIINGNTNNTFSIDNTGLLTLEKALDAETLSTYTLILQVTDGGAIVRSGETTVLVEVQNVDEYPPEIIGVAGTINTSVKEDVALGAQLFKLEARDLDVQSKLSYKITGGNDGHFVINNEFIHLVKFLDRETDGLHTLNLEVSNELNETVTADLRITVEDVNDNDPVFDKSVYSFDFDESKGPGSVVGSLSITDADTGLNAQYNLAIISGNIDSVFHTVGDDIVTKAAVSYTLNKLYTLVIKAEDNDVDSRSSFATVVISIRPTLAVPEFGANTLTLSVNENSVSNDPVVDLDATKSGAKEVDLAYTIRSGNINNAFSIQRSDGKLFIAGKLDFELVEHYTLIIDAIRKDVPSMVDSLSLEIDINNLNDNGPMFSKASFQMTTMEGSSIGTTVGRVVVSDADKGPFGQVSLNMLPSTGSTDFILDSLTGYLTIAVPTEFSRQRRYYLSVVGSDGGSPPQSASAVVVVDVADTNNHDPEFSETVYSFAVVETIAKDDEIYIVKATDVDTGTNTDVTYQIISGNTAGKFKIDAATGAVATADTLDRETDGNYIIGIRATDLGASPRSGDCFLNITVIDVNDNAPQFSVSSISKTVNRFSASRTTISSEIATDIDDGRNGDVTYVITSGNEEGIFLIGQRDGVLTIASTPSEDLYILIVTASDGGSPVRSGQLSVTVRVTPVVQTVVSEFSFSILENSGVGTLVGEVIPDARHRMGSIITYSITSGNFDSLFSIARLGNGRGSITVVKVPDREVYEQYVLIVKELDDDGLSIDRVVKITILDENDNSPSFPSATIDFKVVENTPAGHEVGVLIAADPDEGMNGQITYSIPPVNAFGNELFQIDSNGKLIVKKEPDFETMPQVRFEIKATDSGGKSGLITVNVDIVDVTETIIEAPEIPPGSSSIHVTFEVPDTVVNGDTIKTLTVEDFGLKSADVNAVKFITVGTDGIFAFNAATGAITVEESSKLVPGNRYYKWVICRVVEATTGETVSVLGLIRIDCFAAVKYMIVITFSASQDLIDQSRETIRSHIQNFFLPSQKVVLWQVRGEGTRSRRRLLAAQSSAHIYVLTNSVSNSLNTVQDPKVFLGQESILQALQLSADGTPVVGLSTSAAPVDKVMPYDVGLTSSAAVFVASPQGLAVIALAAAAAVVLLIVIVACIVYMCKKKKKDFLDITESSETGEKKRRKSTAPRFRDIPPVAPVTTIIPHSDSPRTKRSAPDPYAEVHPAKSSPKAVIKNTGTTSSKGPPVKKPANGKNPLLITKSPPDNADTREDNISTLADGDDTSRDTGFTDDRSSTPGRNKPVFHEERLLVGGKVFDGVGFTEATNKPYVYNTKTGEVSHEVDGSEVRLTRNPVTPASTPRDTPPASPPRHPPPHARTISDVTEQVASPFGLYTGRRRGSLPGDLSPEQNSKSQAQSPSAACKIRSRYGIDVTTPSSRHAGSLQDIHSIARKSTSGRSGSTDSGIGQNYEDSGSVFSDNANPSPSSSMPKLITHKLNWNGVSSIPIGRSNRKDIMSRDPVYYDWAKSIARRGRRRVTSDKPVVPQDVSSYITKTSIALPPHLSKQKYGWMNNSDE